MPLAQLADPWQKMPVEGTSGEVSPPTYTQSLPAPLRLPEGGPDDAPNRTTGLS